MKKASLYRVQSNGANGQHNGIIDMIWGNENPYAAAQAAYSMAKECGSRTSYIKELEVTLLVSPEHANYGDLSGYHYESTFVIYDVINGRLKCQVDKLT